MIFGAALLQPIFSEAPALPAATAGIGHLPRSVVPQFVKAKLVYNFHTFGLWLIYDIYLSIYIYIYISIYIYIHIYIYTYG